MPKITSTFDITKPLPKDSWRGNCFGEESSHGRYIVWRVDGAETVSPNKVSCNVPKELNGLLQKEICYISKIVIPHIREKVFPYKFALENPIDLTSRKVIRKLNSKVNRTMTRLGVSFNDRTGAIVPQNNVATAAWGCRGQKEFIAVNPYWIIKADQHTFTRLIKKEVIHKALYRNFRNLTNKRLLNFTLDVISMRVIAQTPYNKVDKQTARLSEMLLNTKLYKRYPMLALLDCSLSIAQAKRLPTVVWDIWKDLYAPDKYGLLPKLTDIQPATLYFRIKSILPESVLADFETNAGFNSSADGDPFNYPFNIEPSQEEDSEVLKDNALPPSGGRANENVEKAVRRSFIPRRYRLRDGFSNTMSLFWDNEIAEKKSFVDEKLKAFSEKWRTNQTLDNVASKIKEYFARQETMMEPYPNELTDTGIAMMVADISGSLLPFYWNHVPGIKEQRKKVLAIFDLSPSMEGFLPYVARIVNSLEEECDVAFAVPTKDFAKGGVNDQFFVDGSETTRGAIGFAGSVTHLSDQDIEDMKVGKFKVGSSTSFQSVLKHIVESVISDAVDCCIIFTDGLSNIVDKEIVARFNATKKTMYKVYFKLESSYVKDGERILNEETNVKSDLDLCKGESFTLHLPYTERYDD